MGYALTSKSQVTIPKSMRKHLGIQPGESVEFEPLPDGRVAISPANKVDTPGATENPFRKFLGIGIAGLSTEAILRETRGEDSLR
jgi:AbrB family looped-hinge helix DNA binding protein